MVDFFYSDPHFGHAKIIEYCKRPFADTWTMEHMLIERYNAMVRPSDTVLFVGDVFLTKIEEAERILGSMNGRKLLVIGNHDRSASAMARIGFDVVVSELHMCIAGRRVRVHHYPYWENRGEDERDKEKRPRKVKGEILIHGHTHSPKKRDGNLIHVGVDAWDYRPVKMAEVEELIRGISD